MKEYYFRICKFSGGEKTECDMVFINDLPYHNQVIRRLDILGAIDIEDEMIPSYQIERIAKVLRLRNAFGVNLSGAAIICDLLDQVDDLERQLEDLDKLNAG